jgi:tetratricopeptide (TPR) repeat protein
MISISRVLTKWWINRRANAALLLKQPRAAIDAYRDMLAIDPGNEFARLMLGNLLAETGDRAGAAEELRRLTEINPAHADAWFNLGYLHEEGDQLDDAERCFRRALDLRASLDRAWYGLGLVLVRAGRLEEAVDAFRHNVKLQPFSPYGYYQLGMTLHHLGRGAEAWQVHQQLAGFEPKFSATLKRDIERTMPQAVPQSPSVDSTKEETTAQAS